MLAWIIGTALTISFAIPTSASAAELRVEIRGASSTEGSVAIALFDRAHGFLKAPASGRKLPAGRRPLVTTFTDLKPGTYAISTFHDVNGNGALDTNLIGLPTEKYGFSRDAEGFMGPPQFEDAALSVGADDQTIVIHLR